MAFRVAAMRQAISPRLAISTDLNMADSSLAGSNKGAPAAELGDIARVLQCPWLADETFHPAAIAQFQIAYSQRWGYLGNKLAKPCRGHVPQFDDDGRTRDDTGQTGFWRHTVWKGKKTVFRAGGGLFHQHCIAAGELEIERHTREMSAYHSYPYTSLGRHCRGRAGQGLPSGPQGQSERFLPA